MFYDRITTRHERLLERYGQGVIELGRYTEIPGPTEFDPPTYTTEWETVSGIARGVDPEYADGTTILVTDMTVQIAIPETLPAMGDVVKVDGIEMSIMRIEPLPSAGEPVAYVLLVRRG